MVQRLVVRNVKGTTGRKSPDGSWIGSLALRSPSLRAECCVRDCDQRDLVGAHVHHVGTYCESGAFVPSYDRREWIIEMCRSHNGKWDEDLELKPGIELTIRANVEDLLVDSPIVTRPDPMVALLEHRPDIAREVEVTSADPSNEPMRQHVEQAMLAELERSKRS